MKAIVYHKYGSPDTVPLQADGAQVGVLLLGARRDGNEYSAQDRETLQQTADIVSDAIALAEHGK
jgi:GAF domain-containing protein